MCHTVLSSCPFVQEASLAQLGQFEFPITLISKSIDEFSTKKFKVVFVLKKDKTLNQYKNLVVEIKKGLYEQVYSDIWMN